MDFIWQFIEKNRSYAGDLFRDAKKNDARLINRLMDELENLLKYHSIHKPEEECRVD